MFDRAAFVASLHVEHQAFSEFCQLLEAEHACLLRSDVDGLLQLTQLKSAKVELLSELAGSRNDYLVSLELDPARQGMTKWLAGFAGDEAPELSKLWHELVELAAKARTMNDSIGALISMRLTHNQAALTAMENVARANSLYGPDGQTSIASPHREIGRA